MKAVTGLAYALAAAVAASHARIAGTGTIEGFVRVEASKQPFANAIVRWEGAKTPVRSDRTGHYLLRDVPALPREPWPMLGSPTVKVIVRFFGYYDESRELALLDGDTAHLDFYMRADPRHEGEVIPFDSLSLERTRCYGRCPAYYLSITSKGRVNFQSRNPGDTVRGGDSVPPQLFQTLMDRAERAGLFELPHIIRDDPRICRGWATDHDTATITIFSGESRTSVVDYHGCFETVDHGLNEPLSKLRGLENEIDSALGSSRWVRRPARR